MANLPVDQVPNNDELSTNRRPRGASACVVSQRSTETGQSSKAFELRCLPGELIMNGSRVLR